MPNKKADAKKAERGDRAKKSNEESGKEAGRRQKRKLPEPPGNLKRRGEWFQKRH